MDFEDRESLGKYIRDDYTNLVDNIVQYQTIDTFSSYLNEHAPKTLSSHTRTVCGQLLFDLLKVPPPILSVNIMVHILSMQLDSQHLLYLSDVLASFPDHLKLDDTISVGSQNLMLIVSNLKVMKRILITLIILRSQHLPLILRY